MTQDKLQYINIFFFATSLRISHQDSKHSQASLGIDFAGLYMECQATVSIPTCLSPQGVKVIDLSALHLLFIFLWQIQQVGHNLMGNKIRDETD